MKRTLGCFHLLPMAARNLVSHFLSAPITLSCPTVTGSDSNAWPVSRISIGRALRSPFFKRKPKFASIMTSGEGEGGAGIGNNDVLKPEPKEKAGNARAYFYPMIEQRTLTQLLNGDKKVKEKYPGLRYQT